MRSALFLASFLATWLAAATLLAPAQAEEQRLTYRHQEVERAALLRRPDALVGRAAPLLVALHGARDSGEHFAQWSGFDAVASREGFAVVYPDALEHDWSYGRPINKPMPQVGGAPADDVGFIRRLIEDMIVRGVADPRRIYVAGVSRGGLMSYTLACAMPDRIAAFAPIISGMTDAQIEDCPPGRPTPLVAIAGTNDLVQFYDGALTERGRLASVPETLEFWRRRNGCGKQSFTQLPHLHKEDRTRVIVSDWTQCRNDIRMRFYRVNGGGHQVPAREPTALDETKFGGRNRDFETAEAVWTFLKDFATPDPAPGP